MKAILVAVAAMLLLSACCYRPTPRPCPPAPSYVAPSCSPCAPAKPVKAVGEAVEK
ncbi:MAG: hypothetical protein KatS3mg130_1618 [Candidatus Sumerlaea sp.]|jgi:hypothetical protein|uniref:Uncharacterized protein n=1 Tax=Sumerlaea chitinivorans TaxID=2250252 RepID=A0A2Z4Y2U7_SUMC1|nr:hypothetical protein BRCON_0275 [Candidatus Sumerlaea chitinivorans]GIX45210.1 MAG: hypothetical protein KatS3mg130_1618 [Candidatus Sumerlaea sp.]